MSRMPRKKRGGSRGSSPEKGLVGLGDTTPPAAGGGGGLAWADVVGQGAPPAAPNQEHTFQHIQEMFKNKIEGEVIYMVLSECDWKVDEALEKLFVLSAENEKSPQASPISMQTLTSGNQGNNMQGQSASSVSNPIPINAQMAGRSNMRLDTHSRLPSNHDQPTTPEILTMLSPKTPAGVSVEFPDPFMGGSHGAVTGMGDNSAIQSAMEALGAYANNPMYMPVYDASKDSCYPGNAGYDLTRTMNQVHHDPSFSNHLNVSSNSSTGLYNQTGQTMAFSMGPTAAHFATTTSPSSVVMNQSQPALTDMGQQNVNLFPPPQGFVPTSSAAGPYPINFSSAAGDAAQPSHNEAVLGGPNSDNQTPLPDLPHITYNAQGMPVRKGHRKKTLSLDPAEREALETLIEDVIIGGVDEGVIDSDGSSSDSESADNTTVSPTTEPQRPLPRAADDTLSPEDQRKFLAGDAGMLQGKKNGEGGQKRGKNEKGKDGGKVYPAQLKVAVKHMKSLPPRFLRRLQTAQKQLEANVKKNAENGGSAEDSPTDQNNKMGDNRGWNNNGNQSQALNSPDGKDRDRDRGRARGDHLKEKKKKIRNLLDDLDQYTDETTVVIEEKDKELNGDNEGNSKSPGGMNLSPGAVDVIQQLQAVSLASGGNQPTSPNMLPPGATINCADLERELLQPKDRVGDFEPEVKLSPMAQRMANLAAATSQQNVLSLASMAQDTLEYSPGEKHSQFSVDAPEFVPKFTPVGPGGFTVPPPGHIPEMPPGGLPHVSVQSMGQHIPPGITPEQLRAIQQQAFLQKPASPFQGPPPPPPSGPMGRASPHVTPAMGRLSPQIIPVSSAAQPQQLSPEQVAAVAALQGRSSPVPPASFIPRKVLTTSTIPPQRPPPSHPPPGAGPGVYPGPPMGGPPGVMPYPPGAGYPIPPPPPHPPGTFPPRLPPGPPSGPHYPQQFPFRPPFMPPNQGYGQWSTGDKVDRFPHHPGPKQHYNRAQGVHKQRHGSPRMGGHKSGPRANQQQGVSPEVARTRVEGLLKDGHKVMVILRGAPGSGKSTIAKEVQFEGVTLTTDDFFVGANGIYQYDYTKLQEAHEWNQKRAKEACEQGRNPIVIDNTNTQAWEMKYYVSLAKMNNYHIEILEPDTPWKHNAKELAKRNQHGVSLDVISKMLERYETNLTPDTILGQASLDRIREHVERQQAKKINNKQRQQTMTKDQQPQDTKDPLVVDPNSNQTEPKKPHRKRKRKRKRPSKKTAVAGDTEEVAGADNDGKGTKGQESEEDAASGDEREGSSDKQVVTTENNSGKMEAVDGGNERLEEAEDKDTKKTVLEDDKGEKIEAKDADNIKEGEQSGENKEEEQENEERGQKIAGKQCKSDHASGSSMNLVPYSFSSCDDEERYHVLLEASPTCDDIDSKDTEDRPEDYLHDDFMFELEVLDVDEDGLAEGECPTPVPDRTDVHIEVVQDSDDDSSAKEDKDDVIDQKVTRDEEIEDLDHVQIDGTGLIDETKGIETTEKPEAEIAAAEDEKKSPPEAIIPAKAATTATAASSMDIKRKPLHLEPLSISAPAYDSREWRRTRRIADEPRKISVTVADLKEALLQELAECELEGDSSDSDSDDEEEENADSEIEDDLATVIETVKQFKMDSESEAELTDVENSEVKTVEDQGETAEKEASYWSSSAVTADAYTMKAVENVTSETPQIVVKSEEPASQTEPDVEEVKDFGTKEVVGDKTSSSAPLPKRERKRPERRLEEGIQTEAAAAPKDDPWGLEQDTEWTNPITTTNTVSQSSPSKRLSPSKQLHAKHQQPAPSLDDDVRQQLLTQSWVMPPPYMTTHPTAATTIQPSTFFQISVTAGNLSNFKHAETCVTAEDLNIVHSVEHGQMLDGSVRVLLGTPREIASGLEPVTYKNQDKILVDHSTSTEEADPQVDSLAFLSNCFPTVSKEDLKDILQNCQDNVEWAVNIMLDAGYEYNDPTVTNTEVKSTAKELESPVTSNKGSSQAYQNFTVSPNQSTPIKQPQTSAQISSPVSIPSVTTPVTSPSSLMDLCLTSKTTPTDIQVLDNIARVSVKRLKSIDEFKRTHSVSECSDTPQDISGLSLDLSAGAAADVFVDTSSTSRKQHEGDVIVESEYIEDEAPSISVDPPTQDKTRSEMTDDLALTLSPQLAAQLIHMFGPVGFHIAPDSLSSSDLSVTLNQRTARQLHRLWAQALEAKFSEEEAQIQAMMRQDEALARRLQQEEDQGSSTQYTRLPPKSSGTRSLDSQHASPACRPPVVGIQPGRLAVDVVHKCPSAPASLRDIMMEEQVIETSKLSYLESQAAASGQKDTISTQLKRQKLLDMFPSIDTAVLDEVFQAHGYCLEQTVSMLQGTHGPSQASPSHLLSSQCNTQPTSATSEQHMIEQAIQNSLQTQWLGSRESPEHEAYQTYEDPEYQDFRAEASMHYRLRHECFQKAQEAYRRGMKSVASFYSQQGHLHTEKLQQANRRAAGAIVHHKNTSLNERNELDLHGLHVDEAVEVLRTVLIDRQADLQLRPDKRRQQLSVITGRGSHSRGGVAKIRPAILDYLRKNGYSYSEPQPGLVKVSLKL